MEAWQVFAACVTKTSVMYCTTVRQSKSRRDNLGTGKEIAITRAKAICARCLVIDTCRDYLDRTETFTTTFGVGACETPNERKRRRKGLAPVTWSNYVECKKRETVSV